MKTAKFSLGVAMGVSVMLLRIDLGLVGGIRSVEEDAPFTADFNGNRRTVSNLFIDRETEDGVGLFGRCR